MKIEMYPMFILSYDLINKELRENEMACDEAYRVCEKIYKDFLISEYNNSNHSEYDCIQEFVESINVQEYIDNYPYLKGERLL